MKSLLLLLAFTVSGLALAEDTPPPVLATCFGCHGQQGISGSNFWPNLAGQKRDYMVAQLMAFRAGDRKNPLMSPIAKGLSDDEISKVTLYFSKLK